MERSATTQRRQRRREVAAAARAPQSPGEARAPAAGRRSEILAIAARCFAENGFEATTIRQISDRAGILSGSLYHHFETKEEMLHELMQPYVAEVREILLRVSRMEGSAEDVLTALIRTLLAQLIQNRDLHAIMHGNRSFFVRSEPFKYVADFKQDYKQVWYGVLQEGVRAGLFRGDLDLHVVTPMTLTFVSATADWFDPAGRLSAEEIIETTLQLLMRGLKS